MYIAGQIYLVLVKYDATAIVLPTSFNYYYLPTKTSPNFINLPCIRAVTQLLEIGLLVISKTTVLCNFYSQLLSIHFVSVVFWIFFCFYNVSCCWSRCHEKICWNIESRTFIFVMICWNFSWVYMTLKKQENKITLIHVELFVFDWDLGGLRGKVRHGSTMYFIKLSREGK